MNFVADTREFFSYAETLRDYPDAFPSWGFRIVASRVDGGAEVIQDARDMMYRVRLISNEGLATYVLLCTHLSDAVAEMEAR